MPDQDTDAVPTSGDRERSAEDEGPSMLTVSDSITVATLIQMAEGRFGNLVKAVVDVARGIMVVDADMHADQEALLLEDGSRQRDLWGINLHPGDYGTPDFIVERLVRR
jgi:hypothetical protein